LSTRKIPRSLFFLKPILIYIFAGKISGRIENLKPVTFLKYFQGHTNFTKLVKIFQNDSPGDKIHLQGLIGSNKTIWIANLFSHLHKNMAVLLNDREEAAYFYDDLNNLGFKNNNLLFPSSYKRSIQYGQPDPENIVQRTETLNKTGNFGSPFILVS